LVWLVGSGSRRCVCHIGSRRFPNVCRRYRRDCRRGVLIHGWHCSRRSFSCRGRRRSYIVRVCFRGITTSRPTQPTSLDLARCRSPKILCYTEERRDHPAMGGILPHPPLVARDWSVIRTRHERPEKCPERAARCGWQVVAPAIVISQSRWSSPAQDDLSGASEMIAHNGTTGAPPNPLAKWPRPEPRAIAG
jgi:hypothetical protein